MLRPLRFLAAAALLAFQAPAALAGNDDRPAAGAAAEAASPRIATPALWVVRDEDTTIHIFGTSHMLPEGVSWLHGPVRRAFEQADTLVLEMVEPEDPMTLRPLVVRLGLNPQGVTLSSQLTPELRQQLAQAATQVGLSARLLEPMKPWLAAITISVSGLQGLGMDPDKGVEKVLARHARQRGMRIEGLETPEEQFGFLASLPQEDQLALLGSTITDLQQLRSEADALMNSWLDGDVETVGTMMNESLRDSPRLARVLLTERNARWAEWIGQRLNQPGHVFLAVGAGHLAGPDSVINLLGRRGLKVERVRTKPDAERRPSPARR